jgi:hypothetical protein
VGTTEQELDETLLVGETINEMWQFEAHLKQLFFVLVKHVIRL